MPNVRTYKPVAQLQFTWTSIHEGCPHLYKGKVCTRDPIRKFCTYQKVPKVSCATFQTYIEQWKEQREILKSEVVRFEERHIHGL
jgi:hypothetical protein